MNFVDIRKDFAWVRYSGQQDKFVTYVVVASQPVPRLKGESDILYIGETDNTIQNRYKQETETNNTPRNTQMTNIRLTYAFRQLRHMGITATCYFVKGKCVITPPLSLSDANAFAEKLETWDKRTYLKTSDFTIPSIEKYLLVTYADEHLELTPLNNRF